MNSNKKSEKTNSNVDTEFSYMDSKNNIVPCVKRNTMKTMGDDDHLNQSNNATQKKVASHVVISGHSHQNEVQKMNNNMLKSSVRQSCNNLIGDNLKSLDVFFTENKPFSKKDNKNDTQTRNALNKKINFDKLNFERQNLNSKLNEHFEKKNLNGMNSSESNSGLKTQNKVNHISSANYKKSKPNTLSAMTIKVNEKILKSQIYDTSLQFGGKKKHQLIFHSPNSLA